MSSFIDELREVRRHVISQATKTLEVAGSGGRLAVRFRAPDQDVDLTPIIVGYKVNGALNPEQERQLIIDCCDQIVHRSDRAAKFECYDPPLRFDAGDDRWDDDVKTARDCVSKLYNLDKQPLATAGIADTLVDWLQGLDAETAARVEGKSGAPADSSATQPDSR